MAEEAPAAPAPKARRPWWRRVLRVGFVLTVGLGAIAAILLVGVAIFAYWLTTPAGSARLTAYAIEQARAAMTEGELQIGTTDTDLLGRTILTDVALRDGNGTVLLGADRVVLVYDLKPLLTKRVLQLDLLDVRGLIVDTTVDKDGLRDLSRVFGATAPAPPSTEPWAGLPIAFNGDRLQVAGGEVRLRAERAGGLPMSDTHFVGLNLLGRADGADRRIDAREVVVSGVMVAPYAIPLAAAGPVAYTGDGVELAGLTLLLPSSVAKVTGTVAGLEGAEVVLDLGVDAKALDMGFLRTFAVGKPLLGRLGGPLVVKGPLSALAVDGTLAGIDGTPGSIAVDATVNASSTDKTWTAVLGLTDIRVDTLYDLKGNGVALTGTLTATGHGTTWPSTIQAAGHFAGGPVVVTQPNKTITFDTMTGNLQLNGGVLGFSGVEAVGPLGRIGATGTLDLVSGELSTDVQGRVLGHGLLAVGVEGLESNPYVALRVTGNVLAADLPLAARGRAEFAPFVYGDDLTADHLVAEYAWSMRASDQQVDVDVTGEGLRAYGLTAVSFTAPDVNVQMPVSGAMAVTGGFTATDSRYGDLFGATAMIGDYTVAIDAAGGQDVVASVKIGEHWLQGGFPGTDGAVGVQVTDATVAFDVDLNDGERDLVTTKGTYGRLDGQVDVPVLEIAPTPRQAWRATAPIRLRVTDGGIADARIAVASDLGVIAIDGTLGSSGPIDGTVRVEQLQLDAVAELFPESASGLAGVLDLDATFSQTAENPRIEATIRGEELWLPGVAQWLDIDGTVLAVDHAAELALDIGAAGEPLARVDGRLPMHLDLSASPGLDPDGVADLDLSIMPGSTDRLQWLSETDLGLPAGGRISGTMHVTERLADPDFEVRGVVELPVSGWAERGRVELIVNRSGPRLIGSVDIREGFAARGHIEGQAATRLGEVTRWALAGGEEPDFADYTLFADDLDVKVSTLGLPVQSVLALIDSPVEATGELLGGFRVTGSPMMPVIAGGLNLSGGTIGGVELTGAFASLLPGINGVEIAMNLAFPKQPGDEVEPNFAIAGHVPIVVDFAHAQAEWVQGETALVVSGTGLPLGVLRVGRSSITDAAGRLVVEGTIGGSPFDPEPKLSATIVDGMIEDRELGVRFKDIGLDFAIDGRRGSLKSFYAHTDPIQETISLNELIGTVYKKGTWTSTIKAQGSTILRDGRPSATRFTVTMSEALLASRSDRLLRLSGALALQGDWPLSLTGDLAVDEGALRYGASAFADASKFEVDPAIAIYREGDVAGVLLEEVALAPSFFADLDVDIGIDLNRAFEIDVELPFVDDYGSLGAFVSTAKVSARLDSDALKVTMQKGALAVVRDVRFVEGSVALFRSNFEIESGSRLTFLGDPNNPVLDIAATMSVSQGSIRMAITGTAEAPVLTFSSEAYPDQTEIFTILVTGEAPEQLASANPNDLLGQATGVALDNVLGSSTGRVLSIDPSGHVRIPMYRRPGFKLEYVWDMRPQTGENASAVAGELQLGKTALTQAGWGDQFTFVDVFWEYRF